MEWGGARVVDWGRLLSGCRGIKPRPQVRILSSPLDVALALSSGRYLIHSSDGCSKIILYVVPLEHN